MNPVQSRLLLRTLAALGVALAHSVCAQNLLTNGGFEAGDNGPAGWKLTDGQGAWNLEAHGGKHSLMARGGGEEASAWLSEALALKANQLYRLSFYAKRQPGASGGCGVSGPPRVNHDFQPADEWRNFSFVFGAPSDLDHAPIRLGQWNVKGEVLFDDAELVPVLAFHHQFENGLELGAGERIKAGKYRCQPDLGGEGANSHRALIANRAGFNSDRWVFGPGASLVYRHAVGAHTQTNAHLEIGINYSQGGDLKIEASRDQTDWSVLRKAAAANQTLKIALPEDWFPAREIFVRLSHSASTGNFQINRYVYEAGLVEAAPDAEGETVFLDRLVDTGQLEVAVSKFNARRGAGRVEMNLVLRNPSDTPVKFIIGIATHREAARLDPSSPFALEARATAQSAFSFRLPAPGQHERFIVAKSENGSLLFVAKAVFQVGFLYDTHYGYHLADQQGLGLWWAESGWKIGRDAWAPPPGQSPENQAIRLAVARHEYEAAQLVLTPANPTTVDQITVQPFKDKDGHPLPVTAQLFEVAYVKVDQPTDGLGWRDWFPDPLPPLKTPLKLAAGQNQPLWITLYAGKDTPPGEYETRVELLIATNKISIPLKLRVHDFALPVESHLRSALGMNTHYINTYHRLDERRQQESVFDKYLQNFAEHRISPYSFFAYHSIGVRFEGEGANKKARVDFTRFDQAAEKWLSAGRFNSFLLPLRGMGGGTFHSRHLGELEGFKEGTPEHARLFQDYLSQIESHLRAKGWLNAAYTYWFDEPDPKDYKFVVDGMKRIKAAAPGVKRMLTEQPEPPLQGHVEIWCGLTPEWSREKVAARQAAGEEVWWYICTGPKSPYVTEFIDHPGTCLRLWPWQSWQYGVAGILIWETLYWTSDAAFPPPRRQDPWRDPMSYVSGYDNPAGFVGYWGNGDGRFLYPPRQIMQPGSEPCLDEPVNSLRWENLRDGMEDYEYLWLLRDLIKKSGTDAAREALVKEAKTLLEVPEAISKDLTHFTTDPRLILQHRERVARMIERLAK